jgi:transposase-like protein
VPRQNDPAFHFELTRLEAIKYACELGAVLVAYGQREMEKRVKPGRNSTAFFRSVDRPLVSDVLTPPFRGILDGDIRSFEGLRHMSISEHKHVSEADAAPTRRVEIFTGAGGRRNWTEQEKAAIVAESFEDGVRACHVARRHGLTPQQLFTWRRETRRKAADESNTPPFVPAIVDAPTLASHA